MKSYQLPKIYVVSLERARERRCLMEEQSRSLDLPITFIDAVDARDPHALAIHSNGESVPSYVGLAELGCALSHHLAFRNFLATDAEFCVILEDDVQISADFPSIRSELYRLFNHRAGRRMVANLCQLQHDETEELVLGKRTTFHLKGEIKAKRIVKFRGNLWGTQGYAINREAAQSLLKRAPDRADAWQWFIKENYLDEIWLVRPAPILHDVELPSYIEESRKELAQNNRNIAPGNMRFLLQRCSRKSRKILYKFIDPVISATS